MIHKMLKFPLCWFVFESAIFPIFCRHCIIQTQALCNAKFNTVSCNKKLYQY